MDKKSERRRKERWDEIWLGVLALHPSNHGLCNIILFFDPLRKKAWQEASQAASGQNGSTLYR